MQGGVPLALMLCLFVFPTSESRERPSAMLLCQSPFSGITENLVCQKGGKKKRSLGNFKINYKFFF